VLENIKTSSLNSTAQAQIKRFIAESGMQAGDLLPTEKSLEEQLGISRASIREALRSLEALGILETRHGVGRFVREFNFDAILDNLSYNIPVNAKDFREMIDVRIALESTFIQQVAPEISSRNIAELQEILQHLEDDVAHGVEDEDLIEAHTEFHLKLYERTGNKLLAQLIRVFATIQRTLTVQKRYRTSDRAEFIELHRRLIQALEAGNSELAGTRLIDHFKDAVAWSDEHTASQL
jgi:DNA-binding FadR family transcriptional regulator